MASVHQPETPTVLRCGLFELDVRTGELRKRGVKIKLQNQPSKILAMLMEKPGQLVSREEIQKRVWGADVTVDFEHSVGRAINKIREALGDSAENPRFIETLSRRGYRFIGQIEAVATSHEEPSRLPALGARSIGLVLAASCLILLLMLIGWLVSKPPRVLRSFPITDSGTVYPGDLNYGCLPSFATDGVQIYFPIMRGGRIGLAHVSAGEGVTRTIVMPPEISEPVIADLSPDGSSLLIHGKLIPEVEGALWVMPTAGGVARRLGNLLGHDATWPAGGRSIIYAVGNDLMVAAADGSESRRLISTPGRAFWLRMSPDGQELRFTVMDTRRHTTALWQVSSDGKKLEPLLPGWSDPPAECCGNWTRDGKYYVFQATRDGATDLWALPTDQFLSLGRVKPIHLTTGPLNFLGPTPSREGGRIYAVGAQTRSELLLYDQEQHQFLPYLPDIGSALYVSLSRDGNWVSYLTRADRSLWRSRVDGSDRLQLTAPPMQVYMMSWSPDATQVVFMGRTPGRPWKLYMVPSGGGTPGQLLDEEHNEADPSWSPDGSAIAFGRLPEYMAEPGTAKTIQILDLKSNKVSLLPGSSGLFSPRWSPDGRYIAAMPLSQSKLVVFDLRAKQWEDLAAGSVDNPMWSSSGKYLYFRAYNQEGCPVYCVRLADKKVEQIVSLGDVRRPNIVDFAFLGLAAGDLPILQIKSSTADIYALELNQP
jgi:Tol biopolymer transport system component/DNA-binding winged helix-turn-helix (wHTH) protein